MNHSSTYLHRECFLKKKVFVKCQKQVHFYVSDTIYVPVLILNIEWEWLAPVDQGTDSSTYIYQQVEENTMSPYLIKAAQS